MEDLSGRVALVSGASKGIGAAIGRSIGAAGGSVIIHYATDRAGAEETGRGIPENRKLLIQADLTTIRQHGRCGATRLPGRGE